MHRTLRRPAGEPGVGGGRIGQRGQELPDRVGVAGQRGGERGAGPHRRIGIGQEGARGTAQVAQRQHQAGALVAPHRTAGRRRDPVGQVLPPGGVADEDGQRGRRVRGVHPGQRLTVGQVGHDRVQQHGGGGAEVEDRAGRQRLDGPGLARPRRRVPVEDRLRGRVDPLWRHIGGEGRRAQFGVVEVRAPRLGHTGEEGQQRRTQRAPASPASPAAPTGAAAGRDRDSSASSPATTRAAGAVTGQGVPWCTTALHRCFRARRTASASPSVNARRCAGVS
ncbi:hypothetical protein [Thermobifida cellulosilytica]|uniref:hypothetical protein n=1 Tax=Thermobifida cellulosilytica TaxID=144786 RepID=UPI0012EED4F4|nr:hypothetical protein [Thermobifida cellulosilytica]